MFKAHIKINLFLFQVSNPKMPKFKKMFSALMALISSLICPSQNIRLFPEFKAKSQKVMDPNPNLRYTDLKVYSCLSEMCHTINQNTSVRPGEIKPIGRTPMPFPITYDACHGGLLLTLLERVLTITNPPTPPITHDKQCCSTL